MLGSAGLKDGIADVVSGKNTLTIHGETFVCGCTAARGFDVASARKLDGTNLIVTGRFYLHAGRDELLVTGNSSTPEPPPGWSSAPLGQ